MIRINDNEDMRFLVAARDSVTRNTSDAKYRFDTICSTVIDGSPVLACTDGKRLHVLYGDAYKVQPGLYIVLYDKKSKSFVLDKTDGKFPDFSNVFNQAMHTNTEASFHNKGAKKNDMLSFSSAVAGFFRAYPFDLNLQFLQDLGNDTFDAWFNPERRDIPCFFINCTKMAAIMPIW
jgi:hypothetical protein